MNTIRIGSEERNLKEADVNWICGRMEAYRRAGEEPCVRISIRKDGVSVLLSTLACGGSGASSRPPNPREQEILDHWRQCGLGGQTYVPTNLVTFVRAICKII